jgi:hypothetical protein
MDALQALTLLNRKLSTSLLFITMDQYQYAMVGYNSNSVPPHQHMNELKDVPLLSTAFWQSIMQSLDIFVCMFMSHGLTSGPISFVIGQLLSYSRAICVVGSLML